ncbi:hypothetical protein GGR57DRAFT_116459 [Xylariaceae sp. FL1272]|nr:hypothetical protein GGR57DRAFT_116459 [Xylariaceae sp. FL1272]
MTTLLTWIKPKRTVELSYGVQSRMENVTRHALLLLNFHAEPCWVVTRTAAVRALTNNGIVETKQDIKGPYHPTQDSAFIQTGPRGPTHIYKRMPTRPPSGFCACRSIILTSSFKIVQKIGSFLKDFIYRQRVLEYQVVLCKVGFGASLLDTVDDKLAAAQEDLKIALQSLAKLPLLINDMDIDWERCKFIVYGDVEQLVERATRMAKAICDVQEAMERVIKARNQMDYVMPDDLFDENRYLAGVNARRLEGEFSGKDEGVLPAWRRPRRNALSILEY